MPLRELRAQGHEVMGLYYNPNIQPLSENQRRLAALRQWAQDQELPLIVQEDYDPQAWFRRVAFRESQRCRLCYLDRLGRASQVAKKGRFEGFSSTLLFSRRQKHDLIAQTGRDLSREKGVEFVYRDWRPFWKPGVELSRQLGLYRQQYCGCLYSEAERFQNSRSQNKGDRDE